MFIIVLLYFKQLVCLYAVQILNGVAVTDRV